MQVRLLQWVLINTVLLYSSSLQFCITMLEIGQYGSSTSLLWKREYRIGIVQKIIDICSCFLVQVQAPLTIFAGVNSITLWRRSSCWIHHWMRGNSIFAQRNELLCLPVANSNHIDLNLSDAILPLPSPSKVLSVFEYFEYNSIHVFSKHLVWSECWLKEQG